jgi:hypothetical protein
VFTGGEILWITRQRALDAAVELQDESVHGQIVIHWLRHCTLASCGPQWMKAEWRFLEKSRENDVHPQSTRLLSPLPNLNLNTKEMWNHEISM